jgi:hypothetical protein
MVTLDLPYGGEDRPVDPVPGGSLLVGEQVVRRDVGERRRRGLGGGREPTAGKRTEKDDSQEGE